MPLRWPLSMAARFAYLVLYIAFTSEAFVTFFFFNATATTEIYTLSLHDALPIFAKRSDDLRRDVNHDQSVRNARQPDRKSTRLNSSHTVISYAVFCLKKKTQ